MLDIRELIIKKKSNEELSEEEIDFFVDAYHKNEILKEQAAALVILMNIKGLTEKEIACFSNAIAHTGEKLELYELSNQLIDIHPIGGMDDKIIIMLLAIMSSLGLPSIKIIGREIGVRDKLFQTKLLQINKENKEEFRECIAKNEIMIVEEPKNIAPVENELYRLRKDIACNDDISIIAINLMSQKIALGFRNIIFDIAYGENSYIKTLKDAERLAKYLINMGIRLDKKVKCIMTRLDEPVGKYYGNVLELREALEALNGNMAVDVQELVLEFGANMLQMVTGNQNLEQNRKQILHAIDSKKAYNTLIEFISKNEKMDALTETKKIIPVMSTEEGYVERIDMSLVRTTAQYLNAIRYAMHMDIDMGAGIMFGKKVGDQVAVGDLLAYIYTNDETKVQEAVHNIKEAFQITNKKIKRKSRIMQTF